MSVLPDPGVRLDTVGMWDLTVGLPEQVAAAARSVEGLGLPASDDIDHVVVFGMGGSGIGGDVLAAIAAPIASVPVTVVKGYECPAYVGARSLCIAVSFSGNTEEVVEAASEAVAVGAQVVAVSSGGALADLAAGWSARWIRLPSDIPMPRAGIGAVAIPLLLVLEDLGVMTGARDQVAAAVAQLRRRRDVLVRPGNVAEELARRLRGTVPIVYGGGALGAVAASRWKNQVNENAKAPAFAGTYPELCHNEICGWGQNGDLTRQVFSLVQLRHDFEHAQVARRVGIVAELVDEVVATVEEVRAEGEGPLAQLLDLVLVGDFVSLHLAYDVGIDPGPIPVLEDIKARLREPAG
jgi:glucose/mannose-6-phosphate isomerase